jgi:transketolase
MRKQFYSYLSELFKNDPRISILLGDIGVFSFRECFQYDSKRIYNMGILEQAMVGVASGLSSLGLIPFIHSIAPFITERCYEQLKLNLGYECKNAFVVSVGNSYDYASLGSTHHCPNDLKIISAIPNFTTFCPGNSFDVEEIIKENLDKQNPKYIRLSETENNLRSIFPQYADLHPIQVEKNGVCIVIGNSIKDFNKLLNYKLNCSILYSYKVSDFDVEKLDKFIIENSVNKNITLIEPCSDSGISYKIFTSIPNINRFNSICFPKIFIDKYGTKDEIDDYLKLNDNSIMQQLNTIYATQI